MIEPINGLIIGIASSVVSIILWEFVIQPIIPEKWYITLAKFRESRRLRNKPCTIYIIKSYEVLNKDVELYELKNIIKNKLKDVFSEFKIDFLEEKHEYGIWLTFNRKNINIELEIDIEEPGNFEGEYYRVLIKEIANVKFKELKETLNVLFWNLNDIFTHSSDTLIPDSDKVKVELEISGVTLFTAILDRLETDTISSENATIMKKDDITIFSIEDKIGPELLEKIKDIVVLGCI